MEHFYTVEEVVPVELKNGISILEKGHCQVDLYAIRSKVNQGLEVNKKWLEECFHSAVVSSLSILLSSWDDIWPQGH